MKNTCTCDNCELKGLFYQNVDDLMIETICTSKVEKEYKKGDVIINVGDAITDFVYLKEGLVKLFRVADNGEEQIFTFAKPFDFVSLLSVFSYSNHNYSVVAVEPSVTCSINMNELNDLLLSNNKFAISVLKKLSHVSDKIIQESLEIKQKNVKGRVAYILLFFSDVIYQSTYFSLPISRKDIANFIGVSTENVIRAMSEFRKEDIIGIFGKHLDIQDYEKLRKIANLG